MPLPVLHSFAGYSIYKVTKKRLPKIDWKWALFFIVLANGPDMDFIPGIMAHQAGRFHRGISHSLGGALLVGFVISAVLIGLKRPNAFKTALWSAVAYFSHPLLDMLNGPGYGMPAFWPFSTVRFSAPIQLIPTGPASMHDAGGLRDFMATLFHPVFIRQFLFECAVLFSIGALYVFWTVLKKQEKPSESVTLVTSASV